MVQSRPQQLSFQYGVVAEVSLQDMTATLNTVNGQVECNILLDQNIVKIPKTGELWTFYVDGLDRVLHERIGVQQPSSNADLQEGDVKISVPNILYLGATYIVMNDDRGGYFDLLTGRLVPSRQTGTPVFAVNDESDVRSIDGQTIIAPCILAVVNGADISFKFKKV